MRTKIGLFGSTMVAMLILSTHANAGDRSEADSLAAIGEMFTLPMSMKCVLVGYKFDPAIEDDTPMSIKRFQPFAGEGRRLEKSEDPGKYTHFLFLNRPEKGQPLTVLFDQVEVLKAVKESTGSWDNLVRNIEFANYVDFNEMYKDDLPEGERLDTPPFLSVYLDKFVSNTLSFSPRNGGTYYEVTHSASMDFPNMQYRCGLIKPKG